MARAGDKADEELALQLLGRHLLSQAIPEFGEDPPDLIVKWHTGERWGVEVTRAYQQVELIGTGAGSSEAVGNRLRGFGKRLGDANVAQRQRGYFLYLEGPGPFSSLRNPVDLGRWEKDVASLVRDHIARNENGVLRFPGGALRPGEPGQRWTVIAGQSAGEMRSIIRAMLWRAIQPKANGLARWRENFDHCWLLILNCYPLADDTDEIQALIRQLVGEKKALAGFDGIFWSGFPDRTLLPIPLLEN